MIELKKQKLNVVKRTSSKKEIIYVEEEMIIPDAKPDILKPVQLSGIPTVYKKEVIENRMRIDGNINLYIMYLTSEEKNETRGINTNIDFSEMINIEKNTQTSIITTNTEIKKIECRIINERKISIRVTLEINIQIQENEEIEIVNEINSKEDFQSLIGEVGITSIVGVGDTKIATKEAIKLDDNDNLAEILSSKIILKEQDVKISYNKLLTKTTAEVEIIFLTEENEIKKVSGKIPIMGFIDIENITENSICDVNYELKNIIIKPNNIEEHSILYEIEIQVSGIVYEERVVNIVQDAYSLTNNLKINMESIEIKSKNKIIKERKTIDKILEIDELKNNELIGFNAISIIKNENKLENSIKLEYEMELHILLYNKQTLTVVDKKELIPFEISVSNLENSQIQTIINIEKEEYSIQTDNRVSVSIDMEIINKYETSVDLTLINDIQKIDEREDQEANVIIYIVKKNDSLWEISKKYGTTINRIMQVNEIEKEDDIVEGQRILIPKTYLMSKESINV